MKTTNHRLEDDMKQGLALLQTMRDEVRLQIHLAGMEAKEEWSQLEPVLAEVEQAAVSMTEVTHHALQRALERLKTFRASLGHGRGAASARN